MPGSLLRLSTLIRSLKSTRSPSDPPSGSSLTTSMLSVVGGPTLLIGAALYFIGYVAWGTYLDAMSLAHAMGDVPLNDVLIRGAWCLTSPAFIAVIIAVVCLWLAGIGALTRLHQSAWSGHWPVAAVMMALLLVSLSLAIVYSMAVRAGNILADSSKLGDGLPAIAAFHLTADAMNDLKDRSFVKRAMVPHEAFLLHENDQTIYLLLPGKQLTDPKTGSALGPATDAVVLRIPRESVAALVTH